VDVVRAAGWDGDAEPAHHVHAVAVGGERWNEPGARRLLLLPELPAIHRPVELRHPDVVRHADAEDRAAAQTAVAEGPWDPQGTRLIHHPDREIA
jgi:hypothetical protein